MTSVTHKFLSMYLFLFITLYMFRAPRAHHHERQIASIQPLVGSELRSLPTCTRHGHQHGVTVTRGCIDTICLSWWWTRGARNMYRVINKNKYIESNLCVTWVINQESSWELRNDFHRIWYWRILRKVVVPFQFWLKSYWNNGRFSWRSICTSAHLQCD